jgi:pimeloyl-ACP methyl ester carboxylesterase
MSFVDVHGRRVACVRQGRGEPLLLIQGMGMHHRMWGAEFLDALTRRFEVVVFDHRGIGASDRADSAFTIADLAEDAAGLIHGLGFADAHVFGISMGGMVAQELAVRHPELVRTLSIGASWAGGPGTPTTRCGPVSRPTSRPGSPVIPPPSSGTPRSASLFGCQCRWC